MSTLSQPAKRQGSIFDEWGRVERSLVEITGLSFATVGKDGTIRSHSGSNTLCGLLGASPTGKKRCRDSCINKTDQARHENRTLFFRCQAGLECFAVPVRIDGRPVAAILGGRILDKAPDSSFFQGLARDHGLKEEKVLQAVGDLKLGGSRLLPKVAQMISEAAEVLFSSVYHHNLAQRHAGLLTSLFRLGTDLSPEKEPIEIYALVVNTISVLFDVEGAFFAVMDREDLPFRVKTAFGTAHPGCLHLEIPPTGGLAGDVVSSCQPLITDDYHQILHAGFPEHVRRAAFFPFFFGEEVRGLLVILNTPLEESARELIFSFCCQASTAVQNVVLRQQLKEKTAAEERGKRVHSLIKPIVKWEELLQAIFEEATSVTGAEQASLMLLTEEKDELVVAHAHGDYSPVIRNISLLPGEGLAGKVIQRGTPLLVTDLDEDSRFRRKRRPRYRSGSFLIVPVAVNGRIVGVINLADKGDGGAFTANDQEILMHLLSHSSIALQRAEFYEMTVELKKISTTDALTQLLNRRSFQDRSTEELKRAERYKLPLSLVMIDLDDFKRYNDQNGHPAGDSLLIEISEMLRASVRDIDIVSRIGGEEFAILSPQTNTDEALAVAERVREAIHSHTFPHEKDQPLGVVSLSAGVATFPHQAKSYDELLSYADRALYRAKSAGKNRVVTYRDV